jgi:acyl-homoserine lactone acylase PvdQ
MSKSVNKWLKRFGIVFVGGFLILVLTGFLIRRSWGRDTDTLNVVKGALQFTAKRNSIGVWTIEAPDRQSLSYGMGYVQGADRRFQTDLVRAAALGRLTELFGDKALKSDRLMRMALKISRLEFKKWQKENPEWVGLLEAFVLGRNDSVQDKNFAAPVEYRVFGLDQAMMGAWEAVDVIAIARFHSMGLAGEHYGQLLRYSMDSILGPEMAALLSAPEAKDSRALYDHPMLVKSDFKKWSQGQKGFESSPIRRFTIGNDGLALGPIDKDTHATGFSRNFLRSPLTLDRDFDWIDGNYPFGASNSWLIADSRMGLSPTLCNDTHLENRYPSNLYPVDFKLTGGDELEGTGFMFPGAPGLVIGRLQKRNQTAQDFLAWGITIANFARSQVLYRLDAKDLAKANTVEELFKIRDPKTGAVSEQRLSEVWTSVGPRIDEIFDFYGAPSPGPLGLDSMALRESRSALSFMFSRWFKVNQDLKTDMARYWDFPSVNYSFLSQTGAEAPRLSHVVTGRLFQSKSGVNRSRLRALMSRSDESVFKVSNVEDREFFERVFKSDQPLFLASANHRPWTGDLALDLAYEWTDSPRADRLNAITDEVFRKPELPQTDVVSVSLLDFLKTLRKEVSVNLLCENRDSNDFSMCVDRVAQLDTWSGKNSVDAWEPTLVHLWKHLLLLKLWGPSGTTPAFDQWVKGSMSQKALHALLHDAKARETFERQSKQNFLKLAAAAFVESLKKLESARGPNPRLWTWGSVHRLAWQHPVTLIPGALGPYMRDSLFGPPIPVAGTIDSPSVKGFRWSSKDPLNFDASHSAVMRMCVQVPTAAKPRGQFRWTSITGVSGNPMSKWAWAMSGDYYFADKLFDQIQ